MITRGSVIENTSTDDLRERVRIVYHERTRNDRGDIIDGEELTRCEVWAKILPLSAKRSGGYVEELSEVIYRITVRYRTDILPDDEILWNGKRLQQTAPPYDAESRRMWTVLECREMVADGAAEA